MRGRDGVVQWRVGGLHLHTDVIAEHSLLRRIEWRQRRLSHAGLRGGGDTGASVVARRPLRQHGAHGRAGCGTVGGGASGDSLTLYSYKECRRAGASAAPAGLRPCAHGVDWQDIPGMPGVRL